MKKIALIIGSMIAGGIISAAGFNWFAKAEPPAEKTSTAERKVLFWYDPMYPNTRFDKPGKSPFMDMDLVPKYADEESSASGVRIDPTQTQNLGVKTATVTRGPLTFAQSFPANVSYNEYQYAIVQARAAGFIDKVYPLTVGDKVQKGTPLLDLTIPDWVEAQSEYLLLRETGGTATQTEGILERLRLAGMPEADIRRLIATQKIRHIGGWFTDSAEVSAAVLTLMVPFFIYQFGDGLQINYANALRGIADVKPLMIIAFVAFFVISLPVGYLCGFILNFGLVGVWMAFPFGLTSAGIMMWWRFRQQMRLNNK